MPFHVEFLDWRKPCLQSCAAYLISKSQSLDFSRFTLAVPGARAGRALLSYLVDEAEKSGVHLTPPRIITPGKLRTLLVETNRRELRLATRVEKQAAWLRVIRHSGTKELLSTLLRELPQQSDTRGWLALSSLMESLLEELSGAGLDFSSALQKAAHCLGFSEEERWEALNQVSAEYLKTLSEAGLRDERDAFLEILREEGPLHFASEQLVLVAVVDLAPALEAALLRSQAKITALVHADQANREGFSATGLIRQEYWSKKEIAIGEENLVVCFKPADQALAVVSIIDKLNCPFEQITVGVLDSELADFVRGQLANAQIPADQASGIPFDESSPALLLKALAEYLRSGGFKELAALIRHSDFERALQAALAESQEHIEDGMLAMILDQYHARHLPFLAQVSPTDKESKEHQRYLKVYQSFSKLISAFSDERKSLISWVFTISDFLAGIYSYIKVDGQDSHSYTTTQAALMIRECLSDVSQLNPVLDIEMSSSDAIVFVLRLLQSAVIARESSEGAVALLGWLELRLDDSPVLIAPGFNDGLIPEAINSDPFLPDRLRSTLGLTDNLKRYARDAYAISSMLASKERVILLSGRQSATGDPLAPSRLLLSSEPQKAAERLLAFYSPAVSSFNTVFDEMKSSQKMAASAAPSFEPYNFTTLSVTAFKDYLQCPYRFYLKHVLKLKRINDHQLELDGRAFGAVAHEALSQLNQSLKRELLCDQNEIFDLLSKCVEEKFLLLYGDEALPAVAFQKIQLLDRLRAFCKWQAQWSEEGWEIIASELSFDGSSTFLNVDGKPVGIKGRIDRLDYNPGSGEFAVFDYKTSDSQSSVEKSHKNKQAWIDLQLPLYYHMLSQSNIGGMGDITAERCKLGYISISRVSSEEKNGFSFASWGEAELEQAFNTAADVVRNIRVAKFWPPAKLRFDDELMALCQIAGEGL